jgi:hypothetical protein
MRLNGDPQWMGKVSQHFQSRSNSTRLVTASLTNAKSVLLISPVPVGAAKIAVITSSPGSLFRYYSQRLFQIYRP